MTRGRSDAVDRPVSFVRMRDGRIDTALIVGRLGGFGQVFATLFEGDGVEVLGLDRQRTTSCAHIEDGDAARAAVARADLVLLCIPEAAALEQIPRLAGMSRPGTLFADITSTKGRVVPALAAAVRAHRVEALSLHPMFSPDGFDPAARFAGRNVLFVPVETGGGAGEESPRTRALRRLVESWGPATSDLSVEEHESAMRVIQIACHASVLAFTLAARAEGCPIGLLRKVETPMSRTILAMVRRILDGDDALYLSIQANRGEAMRARVVEAIGEIDACAARGDLAAWGAAMDGLREWYGEAGEAYARLADRVLAARAAL